LELVLTEWQRLSSSRSQLPLDEVRP
jgi:hypothetical protein